MDRALTADLMKGVGIMIDDDLDPDREENKATNLAKSIRSAGIPLVEYHNIPDLNIIESLGNISFVILDWIFENPELKKQGITMGEEFTEEAGRTILSFLQELTEKCFVPVFVVTGQNYGDVKTELENVNLYNDASTSRVMLCQKELLNDYYDLLQHITQWLQKAPSALVLKMWDKEAVKAKNRMFLEMYHASPSWVSVILNTIRFDAGGKDKTVNHEFTEMINKIFSNRVNDVNYNGYIADEDCGADREAIRRILEGERYIQYHGDNMPDIAYTGDLYYNEENRKYYLNIRAQCDLMRDEVQELFLIAGDEVDVDQVNEPFTIALITDAEEKVIRINKNHIRVNDIVEYSSDEVESFNKQLNNLQKDLYTFNKGALNENKTFALVSCIANKTLIKFNYKKFSIKRRTTLEKNANRIGRILPPYITSIQQGFSSYLARQGVMGIPPEIFNLR